LNISIKKQGWIIRSVVIFNEILFEGESFVVHPNTGVNQIQIPMKLDKNVELELDIRVLMGTGLNSPTFLVHHEPKYKVKKFSMLKQLP
jgi:hypothetical protein